MKKQSKNLISLTALLAVFCIGYATVSFGGPTHNVRFTKHNLGTTSVGKLEPQLRASTETEICIFCHTPHNAADGRKFLWNKDVNWITTFQMYTGSPTLDFAGLGRTPAAPSEASKLCLTCHDGVGALNAMANPKDGVNPSMSGADQFLDIYFGEPPTGWGKNIGNTYSSDPETIGFQTPDSNVGLLLNDHPISFLYSDACANDPTIKRDAGVCTNPTIGGLPLPYSTDNGFSGYKVECVTCHDPHINYNSNTAAGGFGDPAYEPFLRKTMNSSSLCFTCHDK